METANRFGHRTSYTEIGVKRAPCVRCGSPAPSPAAGRVNAGGLCRPVCVGCDIGLNRADYAKNNKDMNTLER